MTGARRTVGDLALVDLGDPSFRAALSVFANRPAMAQAILDEPARQCLGSTAARVTWAAGAGMTYLSIRDGVVRWFVPVRKTWAEGREATPGAAMTVDDLRASAERVIALVERLAGLVEEARREVEATGGPGAAAAWIASERAALARQKQEWQRTKRVWLRTLLIASLLMIALPLGGTLIGPSIWRALFGDTHPPHRPSSRRH